jgi:hypothetical protein
VDKITASGLPLRQAAQSLHRELNLALPSAIRDSAQLAATVRQVREAMVACEFWLTIAQRHERHAVQTEGAASVMQRFSTTPATSVSNP